MILNPVMDNNNDDLDWSTRSEGGRDNMISRRRMTFTPSAGTIDEEQEPSAGKQMWKAAAKAVSGKKKKSRRSLRVSSSLTDTVPDLGELSWLPKLEEEAKPDLMSQSATVRRRRVSVSVQSRHGALAQKLSLEDDSERSVDDDPVRLQPAKKRVSVALSTNPFMDGSIHQNDDSDKKDSYRPSNWLVSSRVKASERRQSISASMPSSTSPSNRRSLRNSLHTSSTHSSLNSSLSGSFNNSFNDSFNTSLNSINEQNANYLENSFASICEEGEEEEAMPTIRPMPARNPRTRVVSDDMPSLSAMPAVKQEYIPTVPILTEEPSGSTQDFTSGRKDKKFEDVYTLGKMLGEGAYGEVYVCTHKVTGAERAAKIIQKKHMMEWEYDDVIKEFQMLTAIDNPNVIRVYEFYDTDTTFYIVQELAEGGELYDELAKHGKLAEDDVAKLMKHILSCVHYLAESNIVHRDINLENILLEQAGNYDKLKLIDFGLAAKVEEGCRLTEMAGKARYLAPEVLGDDGYGLKYDVWSCGVIAFVLLTGEFPFEADSDFDVYNQIVEGYVSNDKDPAWGNTSSEAKDFITNLMTFDEDLRPTAKEALSLPWMTSNNKGKPVVPDLEAANVWVAPKQVPPPTPNAKDDVPSLNPMSANSGKKVMKNKSTPTNAAKSQEVSFVPVLTEEPSGSTQDFTSGRKDKKFEDVYTLGKMLGEGAYGEVYVCTHKVTGAERAAKIIQKKHMMEWEYDDVIKEFQMLTAIDNPNVIRVYEFYDTDTTFYIVQELAEGGELYDELAKHGKLAEDDVAKLMKHILSCVHYLAESNIVHRDINLENILLEQAGNYDKLKLIDFGLAAKVEEGCRLTEMAGKARYLAPEVLGDDGYGLKYDVWSCGVIAFVLLTGEFPFEADSDFDVYNQIVEGYVSNDKDPAWGNTSSEAKDFITNLMTFDEDLRPTAKEALSLPWMTSNNKGKPVVPDLEAANVWIAPAPTSKAKAKKVKAKKVKNASKKLAAAPSLVKKSSKSSRIGSNSPKTPTKKVKTKTKGRRTAQRKSAPLETDGDAARLIQHFFRWATPLLSATRKEMESLQKDLEDIARRRREQLLDVQRNIEFEKELASLDFMAQETKKTSKGQMAATNVQWVKVKKGDLRILKGEYRSLDNSICHLTRENKRLAKANPEEAMKISILQDQIKLMQQNQVTWQTALVCLKGVKFDLKKRVEEEKNKGKTLGHHNSTGARKLKTTKPATSSQGQPRRIPPRIDSTGSSSSSSSGSSSSSSSSSSSNSSMELDKGARKGRQADRSPTLGSTSERPRMTSQDRRGSAPNMSAKKHSSKGKTKDDKTSEDLNGSYVWEQHLSTMDQSAPELGNSSGRRRQELERSESNKMSKSSRISSGKSSKKKGGSDKNLLSSKKKSSKGKESKTSDSDSGGSAEKATRKHKSRRSSTTDREKVSPVPKKKVSRRQGLSRSDSAPSVVSHDSADNLFMEMSSKREGKARRRSSVSATTSKIDKPHKKKKDKESDDTVPSLFAIGKTSKHDKDKSKSSQRMSYSWQDHARLAASNNKESSKKSSKK